jgi:hypothetical protein
MIGAFTTTDCRAAFISIGADSIVRVESDRKSSIEIPRKNPVPSICEVKERHAQHEHGIVNSLAAPKNVAQRALGIGLVLFGFHLLSTLDRVAWRHHRAVGGFFSAPQERADYTSFEGGNKSGGTA